jgi:molybdopterin converting factor small subunit
VGAEGGTRSFLRIHVLFYNIVADHVGKRAEVQWVAGGSSIDDLLQILAAAYPALRHYARADDRAGGPPSPNLFRLFRNGRIVVDTGESLADGDEIRIFPVISGG